MSSPSNTGKIDIVLLRASWSRTRQHTPPGGMSPGADHADASALECKLRRIPVATTRMAKNGTRGKW